MIVVHLITNHFPPEPGGLEMWTLRLASGLQEKGVRVIVYVCVSPQEFDHGDVSEVAGVPIRLVAKTRALWEEPLTRSMWPEGRLDLERARLDFLGLRNSVSNEIKRRPEARHVVVSTFITGTGFLAANVAENLGVPHLPCVVGSDFSRGLRNPRERTAIGMVVRQAFMVVTRSEEQATGLRRAFGASNVACIHTAVDERLMRYSWRGSGSHLVTLFCDGGYSHKKGTQVLFWAFQRLRSEGLRLRLIVCGATHPRQESYWAGLRNELVTLFGDEVDLRDHIDLPLLWTTMERADVYCSATLGEGCSHARMAALCIGIPVVTTRCGEMPDVAGGAEHIRLADPGDADGYLNELRSMCTSFLTERPRIDPAHVAAWRGHFSEARELEQWLALLESATQ